MSTYPAPALCNVFNITCTKDTLVGTQIALSLHRTEALDLRVQSNGWCCISTKAV